MRFSLVIDALNARIFEFNAFLASDHQFPLVRSEDNNSYFEGFALPWNEQVWPSKEAFGVYVFCFANYDTHPKHVIYVGKASLQVMGHRMYAHLNPLRKSKLYQWSYQGTQYELAALIAIPVPAGSPGSVAAALEEYIITKGLNGVELMNSTGRRK